MALHVCWKTTASTLVLAGLLLGCAENASALGCSANSKSELVDGFYQCRDTASKSAAAVEVHASTLNPATVSSTVDLQAMCKSPKGEAVPCTAVASPATVCSVAAGKLVFTAAAGTCAFTVSTPGASAQPIVYSHEIASSQPKKP